MALWRKDPHKVQSAAADLFWLGLIIMALGFTIAFFDRHAMQPGMTTDRPDLIAVLTAIIGGTCWLAALLRRV